MSESTEQLFQRLAGDLQNVDKDRVINLLDTLGLYSTARVLGYDVSHYDYHLLSGRLVIEGLCQRAPKTLAEYVRLMKSRLNEPTRKFMIKYNDILQVNLDKYHQYNYDHDWFSANTMLTLYSATLVHKEPGIETPLLTWMRIAVQLWHHYSVEKVIQCFRELAIGYYTPASPTIFNAGMIDPQMSSCFLLTIEDNMPSILKGLYYGGMISSESGGLGFDISRVRHSEIGDFGESSGVVPMIRMYNELVRYAHQRGRRKGAATIFLRPHHIDVEAFINLSLKVGDQNERAHDVNTCLWMPNLFFKRYAEDGDWTLFCPRRAQKLNDLYGPEFEAAYIEAEKDPSIKPHHKKTLKARKLFDQILSVQRETGMPYLMNGDAANMKSNQKNLGPIRQSNLCLEVIEYTDSENIASCNLHSLSLRMFAKGKFDFSAVDIAAELRRNFDFDQLKRIVANVVDNLNNVIDLNHYPLDEYDKEGNVIPEKINKTNKKYRPIGIGVAGFAEMLHIMDLPFDHPATELLNKMVFGCIYWSALLESSFLAEIHGSYLGFETSPAGNGQLQFDLWRQEFEALGPNSVRKAEDDEPIDPQLWGEGISTSMIGTIMPTWDSLKEYIKKSGLRNSLLIALMPTASTAQIRRNCETTEAHQNNMYSRKVLTGSYPVLNRYMVADLEKEGAWTSQTVEYLKVKHGSIAGLTKFIQDHPDFYPNYSNDTTRMLHVEKKYLTMWELSQKMFVKYSAQRSRYIDQSSSLNIYMKDVTNEKLTACHLYSHAMGLKTMMYYLRQSGAEVINFTGDPLLSKYIKGLKIETETSAASATLAASATPSAVATVPEVKEVKDTKKKVVCTEDYCVSCQ